MASNSVATPAGSASLDSGLLLGVVAVLGFIVFYTVRRTAGGVGGAGEAVGSTFGGILNFAGGIADGVASDLGDAGDFIAGGAADVIRAPGAVVEDIYGGLT